MSRFFGNKSQSTTSVDNLNQSGSGLGNVLVKDSSMTGLNDTSSLKQQDSYASQQSFVKQDSYGATGLNQQSGFNKEGQLLNTQQQQGALLDGQYRGAVSSQTFPNQVGGSFSVTRLEEQELLARGEQIPGKVIRLPEHTGFSIQHPEICVAQEKLLVKHQPINVAQPPVVIQPEAISIPQQPFMWQPEPIAIPLPPLTIQPEPITIQRPDLVIQPDSYVLHRPNLVMNPSFQVRLTYPGQCPDGSICVPANGDMSKATIANNSNSDLQQQQSWSSNQQQGVANNWQQQQGNGWGSSQQSNNWSGNQQQQGWNVSHQEVEKSSANLNSGSVAAMSSSSSSSTTVTPQ